MAVASSAGGLPAVYWSVPDWSVAGADSPEVECVGAAANVSSRRSAAAFMKFVASWRLYLPIGIVAAPARFDHQVVIDAQRFMEQLQFVHVTGCIKTLSD